MLLLGTIPTLAPLLGGKHACVVGHPEMGSELEATLAQQLIWAASVPSLGEPQSLVWAYPFVTAFPFFKQQLHGSTVQGAGTSSHKCQLAASAAVAPGGGGFLPHRFPTLQAYWAGFNRSPNKDHINTRIAQTTVSGIHRFLGLST